MYAIIKTGGKQYKVAEGDVITVEKLAAGEGVIELSDGAGQEYLINADKVAYVRTGNNADRKVGFFA